MVASPIDTSARTKLKPAHYDHLISEGFTPEQIAICEGWGVKSLSATESKMLKLKARPGLYFPFSNNYGQIRLDDPIMEDGSVKRYLGPFGVSTAPWCRPHIKVEDCEAGTEGWKDAAMPTLLGVNTAAFVGVDSIIYALPKDCGMTLIFDSDGWKKHTVMAALVEAAIWTQGRICLFPAMADYPNGGACEYFKTMGDRTPDGKKQAYKDLLKNALTPSQFIEAWAAGIDNYDLSGMFGGKTHEQNYCASVEAVYRAIHKLHRANEWVRVLEGKVEDHRKKYGL
jgi:hypothetical protein